jgi:hypothetical protein
MTMTTTTALSGPPSLLIPRGYEYIDSSGNPSMSMTTTRVALSGPPLSPPFSWYDNNDGTALLGQPLLVTTTAMEWCYNHRHYFHMTTVSSGPPLLRIL